MHEVNCGELLADKKTAQPRNDNPEQGNSHRRPAQPSRDVQIGLKPGVQQQHYHADPGHRFDQVIERRIGRKQQAVSGGRKVAQNRRAENDPGEQFTNNRRLPRAFHQVSQQSRGNEQQSELD
jgi:hypothetical protein